MKFPRDAPKPRVMKTLEALGFRTVRVGGHRESLPIQDEPGGDIYINFHRPCFFPVSVIDHRGKIKKTYPYEEVMTPYEKLKSLPEAESYLQAGVTLKELDDIAHEMSDNEFAERMMKAYSNLFHHISRHISRDA